MLAHIKTTANRFVFPCLTGMLMLYVILRGCMIDITDDEAWSFFNVKHFWWVETLCTGNTHWFNFVAIKLAILAGCHKVWQIRWFSIVSGIGFLFVAYLWLKTLGHFYLKCFGFCFLLLNPYLVEYLSLARGYTTALFFLALSLFFLMKAQTFNEKRQFGFLALLFAGLSAIANFNFLYYFVAFCLVYFYEFYLKRGLSCFKQKKLYVDLIFAGTTTTIILLAFRFIVVCSNDIAAHGGRVFVPSVFGSFIETLLYRHVSMPAQAITLIAYVFFSLVLFAVIFGIAKFKTHQNKVYVYASYILALMFLFSVINKWCFNVLYPNERTTLMFYPLMAIVLVAALCHICNALMMGKLTVCLLCVFFAGNFVRSLNVDTGYDHPYCKNTHSYIDFLNKNGAKNIGMSIEFYCTFYKYYQVIDSDLKGESVNTLGVYSRWIKEKPLKEFDYLLLLPGSTLSWYKNSDVKLQCVKFYPDTQVSIFKIIKK